MTHVQRLILLRCKSLTCLLWSMSTGWYKCHPFLIRENIRTNENISWIVTFTSLWLLVDVRMQPLAKMLLISMGCWGIWQSVRWPRSFRTSNTGLFEMIVGVLTTCLTKYTWDRSICTFLFNRKHSKFLLHTYRCSIYDPSWFYKHQPMMIRCYSPGHLVLQMQPHTVYFNGVTSRIRFMCLLFPQVSRNWRYESEPPLKPSPLTCYKQFGTNSIIVWMFVESQRVHI